MPTIKFILTPGLTQDQQIDDLTSWWLNSG